ncbi:hypothetical protein SAY86_020249 [Trapa natans]|uniref:Exostosin GT47 domain-containing protein n=1 Tax=Trapa natans TaxID=22666 RepID=A0AAN7R5D9_TRANT|nr:hypothetical protein SAY86_020249 [Trapa natans]
MRILHGRGAQETHMKEKRRRRRRRRKRNKLCTWLFFSALCFYFIAPRVIRFNPTSLSRPFLHDSVSSRSSHALVEQPRIDGGLGDLRIYVYELPGEYNSNWLSDERCSRHLFAAEVAIHRALMGSEWRTLDPTRADFFFVPVYVSCNFSTVNGFPAFGHARALLSSAVHLISSEQPFWNRSRGSDHVFVASHDYGACFHSMEEKAMEDGIPEFLKNSIILQTFGVNYGHPCQDVENVVIPPYVPPESLPEDEAPAAGKRDIWVFFRGKMEVHPKNISGRFYGKAVRSVIWRKYRGDRRFYLRRNRFSGYRQEMSRSVFCLCPLGWAPWSPRLVEAAALGCVPVIIADGIRLPFPWAVPWPEISLTVAEADVERLRGVLEHVAATNLTAIQRNLRDPRIKQSLLYNERVQEGDATWQAMRSLAQKMDRSYRRKVLLRPILGFEYHLRRPSHRHGLCYDFSGMENLLNQTSVKKAIGVGDMAFVSCSIDVYTSMLNDWMKDLKVHDAGHMVPMDQPKVLLYTLFYMDGLLGQAQISTVILFLGYHMSAALLRPSLEEQISTATWINCFRDIEKETSCLVSLFVAESTEATNTEVVHVV